MKYAPQGGCGHGFRTMTCRSLIESDLWSRDTVERQMDHQLLTAPPSVVLQTGNTAFTDSDTILPACQSYSRIN